MKGIIQTKRIEKVWVVTWPKGTTQEFKGEPKPVPVDYMSISTEPTVEFQFISNDLGKPRKVWGSVQAVFTSKKEGLAYLKASGDGKCFVLRRAYLSIF